MPRANKFIPAGNICETHVLPEEYLPLINLHWPPLTSEYKLCALTTCHQPQLFATQHNHQVMTVLYDGEDTIYKLYAILPVKNSYENWQRLAQLVTVCTIVIEHQVMILIAVVASLT